MGSSPSKFFDLFQQKKAGSRNFPPPAVEAYAARKATGTRIT
jgi:hypothetical protein